MKSFITAVFLVLFSSSVWADQPKDYETVLIERGRLIVRLRQMHQQLASDWKGPLSAEYDQGVVRLHELNVLQRSLKNTVDEATRQRFQTAMKNYLHFSLPMIDRGDWTLSPGRVDLDQQFGSVRNQGSIGTCSLFAGTALLEAALFRIDGQKYDLSEMWLLRDRLQLLAAYGWRPYDAKKGLWLGMLPDHLLNRVQEDGICEESVYEYEPDYVHLRSLEVAPSDLLSQLGADYLRVYYPQRDAYLQRNFGAKAPEVRACRAASEKFKALSLELVHQELQAPTEAEWSSLIEMGIPVYLKIQTSSDETHAVVATSFDRSARRLYVRNSWGWLQSFFLASENQISAESDSEGILAAAVYLTRDDRIRICFESKLLPPRVAAFCGQ